MTTAYTSLLGLALPTTGELQGTWGDTVNNSITSLLDSAVAGTTTLSTDGDVTLSTTTGAANQSRQAILLCSGARTAIRTITAPAQSKIYTVINATTGGYSVKVVGVGPTTGVTIVAGESALIAWNGSDFIKISNTGGAASFTNVTVSGTATLSGLTASTALALDASKNVVSVTNTGTGNNVLSASPTLTGTIGAAALTLSSDLTLSGGTANGVPYLNGSKVLTTGSALTFDGTRLTLDFGSVGTNRGIFKTGPNASFTNVAGVSLNGDLSDAGLAGLFGGGQSNTYLQATTGGDIVHRLGNTEQMRLTSTGLGIGKSSPSYKLDAYTSSGYAIRGSADGDFVFALAGGVSGASQLFSVRNNSTSGVYINTQNSAPLYLGVNSGTSAGSLTGQVVLDSSGNLGIGTSSPSAKLHVNGSGIFDMNGTGGSLSIYSYSALVGQIRTPSSTQIAYNVISGGNHAWLNNNNEQMRLDSSGNLGLGVTPSAWNLGKAFEVGNSGNAVWAPGNNQMVVSQGAYWNTNWKYGVSGVGVTYYDQFQGLHRWYTAPSGTAGSAISFTQAMTLTAAGELLVGTTSGTDRLQVVNATAGKSAATITGVAAKLFVDFGGGGDNYFDASNNIFRNGSGTERARIDSSGNLLVGTTNAYGKFYVNGQSGNICARLEAEATGAVNLLQMINTATSGTNTVVSLNQNGSQVGSITTSNTATAYNTSSDYRLKNIDGPLTGSGEFIDALKPKVGTWKADGSKFVGFLAHEVQEVSPQSVVGKKDAVDADGKPIMQAMEYGSAEFIANIIAELQSLRKRVAQLEGK